MVSVIFSSDLVYLQSGRNRLFILKYFLVDFDGFSQTIGPVTTRHSIAPASITVLHRSIFRLKKIDFSPAVMSHGLPKPLGKRIYAGTVAEYNTNKYRNTLCAKWLNENDKNSAACLLYTPTSLLTTKSHAQQKLEERHRHTTSEPNFEANVERKQRLRPSETYKRSHRSPLEYARDAIDIPDDFKCLPKYQPVPRRKRAATPLEPVEQFDDFVKVFERLPEEATFTERDETRRNGKRKRDSGFVLEPNNEFSAFFDGNDRKATATGGRTRKVEMFDELGFDEFEFEHNEPPKKRSEATRTSEAMALCKPQDHINMDHGPNFYMNDVPQMSRKRHMAPENFHEFQCEKIERRTKNTGIITMPSRSSPSNPIIFNIQCEHLVIANDNEYKKLF